MAKRKKHKSYLWQEIYGDPVFRFQTNDPAINKRMRQRKDFLLVLWGLNAAIWVYRAQFYSPKEARRTLRRITRHNIQKDAGNDLFFAETGAIVAPKSKGEVKTGKEKLN